MPIYNISWSISYIDISMMCVDGSNNFGEASCIMFEHLITCIVFHEKEYKAELCGEASYIEIWYNKQYRKKKHQQWYCTVLIM